PPRLPPFGFALVTKKPMFAAGFCATAVKAPSARRGPPAAAIAFLLIIVQCSCGGASGDEIGRDDHRAKWFFLKAAQARCESEQRLLLFFFFYLIKFTLCPSIF